MHHLSLVRGSTRHFVGAQAATARRIAGVDGVDQTLGDDVQRVARHGLDAVVRAAQGHKPDLAGLQQLAGGEAAVLVGVLAQRDGSGLQPLLERGFVDHQIAAGRALGVGRRGDDSHVKGLAATAQPDFDGLARASSIVHQSRAVDGAGIDQGLQTTGDPGLGVPIRHRGLETLRDAAGARQSHAVHVARGQAAAWRQHRCLFDLLAHRARYRAREQARVAVRVERRHEPVIRRVADGLQNGLYPVRRQIKPVASVIGLLDRTGLGPVARGQAQVGREARDAAALQVADDQRVRPVKQVDRQIFETGAGQRRSPAAADGNGAGDAGRFARQDLHRAADRQRALNAGGRAGGRLELDRVGARAG